MTTGTTPRLGILGETLVRQGVLTPGRLEMALSEQATRGGRLGAVLVDAGFCTEQQICQALAAQFHLAFVSIDSKDVDLETAHRIGVERLRARNMIPLKPSARRIRIATNDPLDVEAVDGVQALLHVPVETVVALKAEIAREIERVARLEPRPDADAPAKLAGPASETDVNPLLDEVFQDAVHSRATDIHFEPDERVFRVRYRVDGVLRQGRTWPKETAALFIARVKVLADLDICEHRLPQDGRSQFTTPTGKVDMRISILPTVHGEGCVIRLLDTARGVEPPSSLEMAPRVLDPLLAMAQRPHGLILVTGPTGSGKTTTLYSLLSTIDAMEKKVITVEDPVEYTIPMVRQCQVKSSIGFTFASALRAILRHDPEVVLIGEIRDKETAEIATRAALTGHLVMSTLHTNSAAGAVPRLIDMGIEPFLVSSTLLGIVGQRLTRRLCKECSVPTETKVKKRIEFSAELQARADQRRDPVGCSNCARSGFKGRIGLHELFVIDDPMRKAILNRPTENELLELALSGDFRPMSFDGREKVLDGKTTQAEVDRVTMA